MILVGGLTPAWQQILTFDQLQLDEVNRAKDATWCGSGKILNVARALHSLGTTARTICPIGGPSGEAIRQEFDREGITVNWIQSETTTRVCTTLINQKSGEITELVENASAIRDSEIKQYQQAISEFSANSDVIVLSGSLPAETPREFYSDLINDARGRVILDARGPELTACLKHTPLLVKPNRTELEQTAGESLTDQGTLLRAMRELVHQGAESVLVTDGTNPAWLVSESEAFSFTIPSVLSVNPIGCGDSLTAGIAAALDNGSPMVEAVRFGLACAAANAEMLLPAQFQRSRVEGLLEEIIPSPLG